MRTIAVDAMGGDYAPAAPVEAVVQIAREHPETHFILVGDEASIRGVTEEFPQNVSLVHTSEVISGTDEPVRAVRRKTDASLVVAAQMVHDKSADVLVSAGNTGAIVAAGMLIVGRLPNVGRPALAPVLPTFNGDGVLLLDAGATMDADAKNLLDYSYMANTYATEVLDIAQPRIGLLNVGTEDKKGNALTKETFELLKKTTLNFVGNVEARDMLAGICDVVVCDGFVGNVVLKLAEGVGLGMFSELKGALLGSVKTRLAAAVLKPELRKFRDRFDYPEYGGAPFLGVAGGCFKAHGSSNPRAWYIALLQARKFAENQVVMKMTEAMESRSAYEDGEVK